MQGKIFIFGANGQVGNALRSLLSPEQFIAVDHPVVNFSRPETLQSVLELALAKCPLQAVINAAAYTQVDQAENEEEKALAINATAPGAISKWCAAQDIPFFHYSTDYVFPGTGDTPWKESDACDPVNAYGRTKLAGEKAVLVSGGRGAIFRTSWIYDIKGRNFLNTMLRHGKEEKTLSVVSDQVGAPTFATDLAIATLKALDPCKEMGIFHVCNIGETSWHGFAEELFEIARKIGMKLSIEKVLPIQSSEYPTPARRPHNSRLNTDKAWNELNIRLPDWKEGLRSCMANIALIESRK